MRSAVCALNSKYIHSSLAPWCLLAGVRAFAPEKAEGLTILEGTINQSDQALLELLEGDYELIAFSCYIWNISTVRRLLPMVKERHPNARILLGGPEVSYNPREVLTENTAVDMILCGEGEKPFALLLCALAGEGQLSEVPGLCFRASGELVVQAPYISAEEPPSPYCPEYFQRLGGRMAYLETSRGCPFSCTFCLSGRGGGVRLFSIERAKRELVQMANSGTRTVKLVDRTFNCNPARTRALCAFLIAESGRAFPSDICFHFEVEGDLFDPETIRLLATAPKGLFQMEVGLQSFYPKTLSAIRRNPSTEKLSRVITQLLAPRNIHIHIDLIAGLPYETFSLFADSFDSAYQLRPDMLQLGFLKLLHGAALRDSAVEDGCRFSKQPPYEIQEGRWISKEELARLHETEDALERLYNSGRFHRTMEYVLEASGLSPFAFYSEFGAHMARIGEPKMGLDDYIAHFYEYAQKLPGVQEPLLRDALAEDRIATNSTGRLPKALLRRDPRLKQAVLAIQQRSPLAKGTKRGTALLYGRSAVVFADYLDKDPVTGEYPLCEFSFAQLGLAE